MSEEEISFEAPEVVASQPSPPVFGDRGDEVKRIQELINSHSWRPSLPLLPVDGVYGNSLAAVLAAAGRQVGVNSDGKNFADYSGAFEELGLVI